MTATMSIAISAPTSSLLHSSSSSLTRKIPSLCYFSNSAIPIPKNAIFQNIKCVPNLGLAQWSGLKNMGVSTSQYPVMIARKGKCRGKGVYASLFGVGAPEVLVIGVVALLVFGPKGLAEVARNLGKTLRAFQPTIRELQEVSREFKSTLEREIGLDDIDTPVPKRSSTNTTQPETNIEPKDPAESALNMKAEQFKGALSQLKKEQEEERKQKEEEERLKQEAQLQGQVESKATSQDASEAPDSPKALDSNEETASVAPPPKALDTTEETSSITPPPENPDSKTLQEAAAGAPTGSASNTET
ncbi:sec-independent protein translocase protein TATB, chloroplastic-like isoform X2 [Salvia splendens]|uniref:sec-independent protein translocase protein TATB, chloroplastic-like isoform X2 n=1 Tax=Salvia splendens TaxID=180675 RepID=UPI001C260C29|nr:sec-independent protein translocase protein TATB, chloroplastic-like isoform X2 [Salvia splendens]